MKAPFLLDKNQRLEERGSLRVLTEPVIMKLIFIRRCLHGDITLVLFHWSISFITFLFSWSLGAVRALSFDASHRCSVHGCWRLQSQGSCCCRRRSTKDGFLKFGRYGNRRSSGWHVISTPKLCNNIRSAFGVHDFLCAQCVSRRVRMKQVYTPQGCPYHLFAEEVKTL
jgi:hypothetical protein